MNRKIGLYIHIPFCKKKCNYCAFFSLIWNYEREKQFIFALKKEIDCYQRVFQDYQIKTLYFGGGTPSVLSVSGLFEIFSYLNKYIDFSKIIEKTFELNPESVTQEKIQILKDFSFNRISLGVQSFIDQELKILGRIHDSQQIIEAVEIIKYMGFTNFNLDYIFGLPGSSLKSTEFSLKNLVSLKPTHISTYALSIEEQSKFKKMNQQIVSEEESLMIFQFIQNYLKAYGYKHYEVSAFAKPGFESRHNLNYWRGREYLGLGPGAHSFLANRYFKNAKNFGSYSQNSLPQKYFMDKKPLNKKELIKHYLITNFRLLEGFSLKKFKQIVKIDFLKEFQKPLEELLNLKLIKINNNKVILKEKGLNLLDSVLTTIIS